MRRERWKKKCGREGTGEDDERLVRETAKAERRESERGREREREKIDLREDI